MALLIPVGRHKETEKLCVPSDELPRGLACNLQCVECSGDLVFKRFAEDVGRRDHFAHRSHGDNCTGEGAVHKFCVGLFNEPFVVGERFEVGAFYSEGVDGWPDFGYGRITQQPQTEQWVEKGVYRPDVQLVLGGCQPVVVEIHVSNAKSEEDVEKAQEHLSDKHIVVEVDIDKEWVSGILEDYGAGEIAQQKVFEAIAIDFERRILTYKDDAPLLKVWKLEQEIEEAKDAIRQARKALEEQRRITLGLPSILRNALARELDSSMKLANTSHCTHFDLCSVCRHCAHPDLPFDILKKIEVAVKEGMPTVRIWDAICWAHETIEEKRAEEEQRILLGLSVEERDKLKPMPVGEFFTALAEQNKWARPQPAVVNVRPFDPMLDNNGFAALDG